jgi:uncharacterized FlaG/YvyC family protein
LRGKKGAAPPSAPTGRPSAAELQDEQRLAEALADLSGKVEYRIVRESRGLLIRVRNPRTGEDRVIAPEKLLKIRRRLDEMLEILKDDLA